MANHPPGAPGAPSCPAPATWHVWVPSKGRADHLATPGALAGRLDAGRLTVVVHSAAERLRYRMANPQLPPECIVASETDPTPPGGKLRQFEWIFREAKMRRGEWCVLADDNIRTITALPPPYYDELAMTAEEAAALRPAFAEPVDDARWLAICADTARYAERVGAWHAGFATTDNPFFRARKFRAVGWVIGKLTLWRYDPAFRIDTSYGPMDDKWTTAEHLLRYGAVAINNYVKPVSRHYEAGGHGPIAQRGRWCAHMVPRLLAAYPGLYRIKDRPDGPPDSDLAVRLTTRAQVASWRHAVMRSRLRLNGKATIRHA